MVTSLAGILLTLAGAVAAFVASDAGGVPRATGLAGLVAIVMCATSRGVGLYRAGVTASLPTSVGRTPVRVRPARGFGVSTVALAVVLPLVVAVAVLDLVEWAWLLLVGVVLLGCGAMIAAWTREAGSARPYEMSSAAASERIRRLCMRADMPVPELVVEHAAVANAWTARGRIHVTTVLLAFAGFLTPRLTRWTRDFAVHGSVSLSVATWILAVLAIPPAFVVGWISRLSVLGMSRAREFSADAAAVTLTGRPSALASALLKLEGQRDWAPRADLRQVEADAVLCIVGSAPSQLGRLFSTHPATAARVKRLEAIESRIHVHA